METLFLLILIGLMIFALGAGFPVAFALPGAAIISVGLAALAGWLFTGDVASYFYQGDPIQWLTAGVTNFRDIYWEPDRDTLIAIPLFIFMGIMLQRSKIAEDLLVTMAQLFGPIPGGLGISVVFVGALLAATTGIVGATVVAMGLISLPAMMRSNYSKSLACGTIAASGTLGQIIPPSIVLIILADQLSNAVDQADALRKQYYTDATGSTAMPSEFAVGSTSAGEMFLGALMPGLVLVGLYMLYILVLAIVRPSAAPSVRFEGKMNAAFWFKVVMALAPPLTLIIVVLGAIIMGIATVNQAGAIGAVGATVMAGYRLADNQPRQYVPLLVTLVGLGAASLVVMNFPTNVKLMRTPNEVMGVVLAAIAVAVFLIGVAWSFWRAHKLENTLHFVMMETSKATALVFVILIGAAMLTAAFRGFGGEHLVRDFLTDIPGGFWAQFIVVMTVIFLLGFFIDFIEIAIVVVPIVTPILLMDPGANVTAVWLGVMIGLNIQTSFLTPPFGFALFYLRGVASQAIKTLDIYKGVVPFIALQLLALVIVGMTPWLVNYWPTRNYLLADTAPPPSNPRLQYCIEQHVMPQYKTNGPALRAAIAKAKTLDFGYLPSELRSDVTGSFAKAEQALALAATIDTAAAAVTAAIPAYRPVHQKTREIQQEIARIDIKRKGLIDDITRLKRNNVDVSRLESRLAVFEDQKKALAAQIPANWDSEHKKFQALQKVEDDARRRYRNTADQAYQPIEIASAAIAGGPALIAAEGDLRKLPVAVTSKPPAAAADDLDEAIRVVTGIEGARGIRNELQRARSTLRARNPDPARAKAAVDKAMQLLTEELTWRKRALAELKPGLDAYNAAIAGTIGLREQARLPRDIALIVAGCMSNHRDVSLNF